MYCHHPITAHGYRKRQREGKLYIKLLTKPSDQRGIIRPKPPVIYNVPEMGKGYVQQWTAKRADENENQDGEFSEF